MGHTRFRKRVLTLGIESEGIKSLLTYKVDSLCRYLWPYGDDGGMSYNKKML